MNKEKIGYLYIVTNEAFPGFIKVGITSNLKERLHIYQTCDPLRRYKLVYSLHHPKFKDAEKNIKNTMKYFASEIRNEWYKVDLKIAISRLEEQLSDFESGEWHV